MEYLAKGGLVVEPDHPDATAFNAPGAIFHVADETGEELGPLAAAALRALACVVNDDPDDPLDSRAWDAWDIVANWNDAPDRTVGDVLAAFDRAIGALELP